MASKSVLIGGRTVNVKGRSSFDKSFLNALTSGVGTITPILTKLVIPSNGRISMSAHAELPPLATDAYLRSHVKYEAFYTPARLLTASFQSWLAGEQVYDHVNATFDRAKLPRGIILSELVDASDITNTIDFDADFVDFAFGACSLTDYFNMRFATSVNGHFVIPSYTNERVSLFAPTGSSLPDTNGFGCYVNLLPYINYHFLYHHFYRNKSVQRPVFAPTDVATNGDSSVLHAYNLPYVSTIQRATVLLGSDVEDTNGTPLYQYCEPSSVTHCVDTLLDGVHLYELRQRNYGDDYFTAARPQAQAGNPVVVQTDSNGRFSIASLRLQNALQEFSELNGYATPDYVQVNLARYGVSLSNGVVQKPVVLASADFPMFTKSVELNAQTADANNRNPFAASGQLGAVGGKATANGIDFSFDFQADEVGYIMVLATLVPEANYATGFDHSMRIFIDDGDLTDLPCSLLEHIGDEPIMATELAASSSSSAVFGYVQRYLWHKAGTGNQVHGLYRKGMSLQAFVPQRNFGSAPQISSNFLVIGKDALDDVSSVASGISQFGLMLDCAFTIHISEPLAESALPALSDPALEHGREVYLHNGGSSL